MKKNLILSCCLASGALLTQSLHANITFSAEPAGDETSTVSGVTTATFDAGPLGDVTLYVSPIGTLTGGTIFAANEYGGAGGTDFYGVGNENSHITPNPGTLTFNSAQTYFGMWWSATDIENSLTFYNGLTPLGTFTSAEVTSGLSSSYLGNPSDSGADGTEDFVYLNFTESGGLPITSVVFNNGTGTGFEMDNLSIKSSVPDVAGTMTLLGFGLSGLAVFGRRFRK